MNYDLSKLSLMQQELDEKIAIKHQIGLEETTNERVLAFLVELGELANETRCFKYWSLKSASAKDIILEEYVDGIHFLISLCNQLNQELFFEIKDSPLNMVEQFLEIYAKAALLKEEFSKEKLSDLFVSYLRLGKALEFTNDTIITGYLKKNQLNHQRQAENY